MQNYSQPGYSSSNNKLAPQFQLNAQGLKQVNLERNGLRLTCFYNQNNKLVRKVERFGSHVNDYLYQYDQAGHLLSVRLSGALKEQYQYNASGQRVHALARGKAEQYHYSPGGRLLQAGNTRFTYNRHGALSKRLNGQDSTSYFYGTDTLLDKVRLASGKELVYEYDKDNRLICARKYKDNTLVAELVWRTPLCLQKYRDYENQLDYTFTSNKQGHVDKIQIAPMVGEGIYLGLPEHDWPACMAIEKRRSALHKFFSYQPMELNCGVDQVGTLKVLFEADGSVLKFIDYDSFGNVVFDSMPELFIPIGFAGGLADRDTGLVHFGFRDYDPWVGRFTAPDPLGDTGGDHDLYDYCIDDPVSMHDPAGLLPIFLLPLLVGAGALGKTAAIGGIGSLAADAARGTLYDATAHGDMAASPWAYGLARATVDSNDAANPSNKQTSVLEEFSKIMGRTAAIVGSGKAAASLPGAGAATVSPTAKRIITALNNMKYNPRIAAAIEIGSANINPMYPGGGHWLGQALVAGRLGANEIEKRLNLNNK